MKLAILRRNAEPKLAAVFGEQYVDISRALPMLSEEPVGELRQFITRYHDKIPELETQLRQLMHGPAHGLVHDVAGSEFLPPVPKSPKLLTARGNSTIFTRVVQSSLPKQPVMEMRYAFNIVGHDAMFTLPQTMGTGGWNMELVTVLGQTTSCVGKEDALANIFGYTLMLDHGGRTDSYPFARQWAIPDDEKTMMDWFFEGCFNGNAEVPLPVGPVIVSRDEIADPHDLSFEERESGRLINRGHTGSVLFTIPEMTEYISAFSTLEPGDMVSTASIGYDGYPLWPERLPEGAYYEATMQPIGTLRLRIVDDRRLTR